MKARHLGLVALLAAGCSSNDPAGTATGTITTTQGGTIEVGAAKVEIPPNAVPSDTQLTVRIGSLSEFAAFAGARDQVLVFEPPITLTQFATIAVDPGDPAPAAGQLAELAQFSDGAWHIVDSSTFVNPDGRVESGSMTLAPTVAVITTPSG